MLLDSRFKSVHRSLCCFAVGFLSFSTISSAPHVVAQQVQVQQIQTIQNPQFLVPQVQAPQQTFGPLTRIYQQPIIPSPIYQGPSYYPQQTPIGPIYQTPQETIRIVPPVAERVQPSQRILDQAADQADFDAKKISVLEKLLEKYRILAAKGQESSAELEALKLKNSDLLKEVASQRELADRSNVTQNEKIAELTNLVERMRTQYAQSETKVRVLEKRVAAADMLNSSEIRQVATLKAQVSNLGAQLRTSANENKSFEEKQEAFRQENTKLKDELARTQNNNQKLNNRIAELSGDSNVTKFASADGSGAAQVQATSFASPTVDVSSFESKIAQLTRKNRQLADNNANFKSEIKSLSRELASLKTQGSAVDTDQTSLSLASNRAPTDVAIAPDVVDEKGGWGTLGWLLPFLAIGLGVAFFVILKEEFQRPLAKTSDRKD